MNPDHLATQPLDDVDVHVLDTIADILRAGDPVPAGLVDEVKFALTMQALHAEVAELQALGVDTAAARSAEYSHTQTLTFGAEALSVMITLSPLDDDTVRIDGWVTGHDGTVSIELRAGTRTLGATTDADGRFIIDPAPRGLVRFVFTPEGEVRPVITPTVEI
ncbi:carboxypeptidase regulatory-like domain-containing protein [Phycicoccus sonneratiae]|uniref:Carboxypeptidase regulatory-like domain-containing protein n=1 Tax=Phycicoccus sonneratiae TaxID=2807628 RepID=A0ABS2CQ91_9MICO|nr:carboxypeptidase regulatory-like domain-containing protein [Phycicoccus sonneraticus]MBM6401608.1 carboxypeptidase regulatory-like domain-containing protein [Phycicoccus sonneraticus]